MQEEILRKYLLDYMNTNNLTVLDISLQTNDVNKQIFENLVFKPIKNISEYKSYDWLRDRLGYYAIFGLKLTKEMLENEWDRIYNFIIPGVTKNYCYIIDPNKPDTIKTSFYHWIDVHYLLNEGTEEEQEKERSKFNLEYITDIMQAEFIQLLFSDIKKDDIMDFIKYN